MSNRDIIEHYYRQHRDELLTFVGSRLGVKTDAEDLVQDVFLRLLADSCRPITPLTLPSLVYTMARNLITDHYRRRRCQQEFALLMEGMKNEKTSMESAIFARDALRCMEQGLSRLPSQTAEIYRLHIYDGMQVSDISRHLHQDYKAVEYRLGQARRLVRRLLRHQLTASTGS